MGVCTFPHCVNLYGVKNYEIKLILILLGTPWNPLKEPSYSQCPSLENTVLVLQW